MISTKQIQVGRWYRRAATKQRYRVLRVFGRGRHRQVACEREDTPGTTYYLPIRSFAQRFEVCE